MRRILLLSALLLTALIGVQAQGVTTASISGIVVDTKGEPLPGANVVAIHLPSGTEYGASTLASGRFNLPAVRIGGPYRIAVTFVGYETYTVEDVNLSLGQNFDFRAVLIESGTELAEIVVTTTSIFNADRTGASTNISSRRLQTMPTLNRSFTDMTRLTPQASGTSFAGRNNLYNNLSIDGSILNNSFGLASLPGGQTNSQPISLDALEEITVNVAPYDVRQGGFTGAGINAVTRSGTNEFSGSAYYFTRNENSVGSKVANEEFSTPTFTNDQYGLRIGGPIIKNKLFFFLSGELERRADPIGQFTAKESSTESGARLTRTEMDAIQQFLSSAYGYEAGPYQGYDMLTESDKITARIDYNINKNHKISFRYNYLKSIRDTPMSNSGSQGGRQNSQNSLPFRSANYIINNNFNSFVAELNSIIGKNSNNLVIGWTGFRDFRSSPGGVFPYVDIENGNNQNVTSFGYELFSANNKLDQDVFQISDNFSIYLPKHTITIGTANEFYSFANGFMPNFYSRYRFRNYNEFFNSAPAGTEIPVLTPDGSGGFTVSQGTSDGTGRPTLFNYRYSAVDGVEVPLAEMKAAQIGFYVQDEWTASDRLKLTAGLRIDIPYFPIDLPKNPTLDTVLFTNAEKIDVSRLPDAKVLFSPRVGFNWDVKGDKSAQVRGGTGVFTGRIPFVWMSNQASNNGVLFGVVEEQGTSSAPTLADRPFDPDPTAYRPGTVTLPPTIQIAATDPNFKFPQVWRSNLALDYKLPYDVVMTLEGIFTKDINAVYHRNANLTAPVGIWAGDGRVRYAGTDPGTRAVRYTDASNNVTFQVSDAIVLDNTNKGWSASLSALFRKDWNKDFSATVGYNYGPSYDLTSNPGSIAFSAWSGNQVVGDPNQPVVSYSSNQQLHRLIASASFRKEYASHFATSITLFYEARSGQPFSYIYSGDMNGDRVNGNDLIYIPRNKDEILLASENANDTRTIDEIWNQLDAYISQDKYLSEHRGQYAARNGAETPWSAQLDIRILQDFYINVNGKRNTLQVTFDIFNFGNMLNPDWGVIQTPIRNQLLTFIGQESSSGRPVFSFPLNGGQPLNESFRNSLTLNSVWQAQLGIRYIFN
jgi:hypothetical protein